MDQRVVQATSNWNPTMASTADFTPTDSALAEHDSLWRDLSDHVRGLASIRGPLSLEDLESRDWRVTILRWTQRSDIQVAHPHEALLGLRAAVADMDREEAYFLAVGLAGSDGRGGSPHTPDCQNTAPGAIGRHKKSA